MSLIAKSGGDSTPMDPIPSGNHLSVCYALIDMGTQYNPHFDKSQQKVCLVWEVPEFRIDVERDGKELNLPRVISKQYTLSLGEKANLRKDLIGWRGRDFTPEELDGFDLRNVVGVPCMLQVVHQTKNDRTYASVAAVSSLPSVLKDQAPKPENDALIFSVDDIVEGDPNLPEAIPGWMQAKIKESQEWANMFGGQVQETGQVTTPQEQIQAAAKEPETTVDAYEQADDMPF